MVLGAPGSGWYTDREGFPTNELDHQGLALIGPHAMSTTRAQTDLASVAYA